MKSLNRRNSKAEQASRLPCAVGAAPISPLRGQGRRDACPTLRFVESHRDSGIAHWGHEPNRVGRERRALPPLFMGALLLGAVLLNPCRLWADSTDAIAEEKPTVIVVVGAAGDDEYGQNFAKWAGLWEKTSREAGAKYITIGLKDAAATNDLAQLQKTLADEPTNAPGELWLVLLGHGTFDGKEARFNLRGPDLTATNLALLLKPFTRPVAVINAFSSSGPFLHPLSAPARVVITATRSGNEQNYARFGQYFSEAIADPQADLDKDGQTSLLEAWLTASYRVAEFYKSEGRLATEHALLDDNGDGLGTPPDWFRGVRAVKKAKDGATLDGPRAHQFHLVRSEAERRMPAAVRARRDQLELAVAKLREAKEELPETEYYQKLEPLLLELARLYDQLGPKSK